MKRLVRISVRLFTTLAVLLLAVAVFAAIAVLWVGTDDLIDNLGQRGLRLLSQQLQGEFHAEHIAASFPLDLRLTGVTIELNGETVLSAPELRAQMSLCPAELIRGIVRIDTITITEPHVDANRLDNGDIDFFEVFVPAVRKVDDGSSLTLLFDRIAADNGEITLQAVPPGKFQLRRANAVLSVSVPEHGVVVDVSELTGELTVPEIDTFNTVAAVRFDDTDGSATIGIRDVELRTDRSRILFDGVLSEAGSDFDGLQVDSRIRAPAIDANDLRRWLGSWPATESLTGEIRATGDVDTLTFAGSVGFAKRSISVGGTLDLRGTDRAYSASLEARDVALDNLSRATSVSGSLSVTALASGPLDAPERSEISFDGSLRRLRIAGRDFGDFRTEGRLAEGRVRVNAEVEGPSGKAGFYGTGQVSEPRIATGDVYFENFDLTRFADIRALPRSAINATSRIRVIVPADSSAWSAEATTYLAPSEIEGLALDTGVARVAYRDSTLEIEDIRIAADSARLTASGELSLATGQPSRLDTTLTVPRLFFSKNEDRIAGGGRLDAEAHLRGPLASPRIRASAHAEDVRAEALLVDSISAIADVGIAPDTTVVGSVSVSAREIAGPVRANRIEADVDLDAADSVQRIDATLEADVPERGIQSAHILGTLGENRASFRLDDLKFGTRLGQWTLEKPAVLDHDTMGWTLSPLRIESGDRLVQARGRVPDRGEIDASATVSGIDLAFLFDLLETDSKTRGTLSAEATLSGSVAQPRARLQASSDDLWIEDQLQATARLEANVRDDRLVAEMLLDPQPGGWMRAILRAPIDLRLDRPASTQLSGAPSGTIEASDLPAASFAPLLEPTLRDVGGSLAAELSVGGTLLQPEFSGTAELGGAEARIPSLGIAVEDASALVRLSPGEVRIERAQARSRDGEMTVRGSFELDGIHPSEFDLQLEARRWPAIRTKRYKAEIAADLSLQGSANRPQLAGEVTVKNADLKPELDFLDSGAAPSELDPTISVIDTGRPSFAPDLSNGVDETGQGPGLPDRIETDITLVIERGTRIRHEMADVEVRGKLRVRRQPGEKPVVTGRVESVRGTIEIQGREFKLDQAIVTFAGGSVENPRLDIVATHRRSPYLIEARIGGTVDEPTLTLSSEPSLDQADILSVLIFGRPSTQLDQGEKTTLQQQALNLTSGYAASLLGQAVSEALGLEDLGLDLSDVTFTGGSVGFGRYITSNTYVSVTQHLGEDRGREVNVEYFLTPHWKIVTSTDSLGASGADIIWQTLY